MITALNGDRTFRSFLLGHNLSIGSVFTLNFSPKYSKLVSLTVRQKILSLRIQDFEKIECEPIA